MNSKLNLSEKSQEIQTMFDKISPRYNFLNRLLSFGQDTRWRKCLIKNIPVQENKDGVLVDVACGTGDVIYSFNKKRTDYKSILGLDISQGMLNQSRLRNNSLKIKHIQASAEQLPLESESANCITIAFGLRNVEHREQALKEFHRVLKTGGALLVLEFFPAKNSHFQTLFNFYFKKILPRIGGLFSDKSAYTYLPHSVKSMPTQEEFTLLLTQIGFSQMECTSWLSGSTMLFKCIKN